jgi:chromosome segregation ATPase
MIMTATTPYRRLQERNKELEEISKSHQKQVGDLISDLKDKETIILLQKENHKREIEKQNSLITYLKSEIDDLNKLSQLLKHSNYLDNADENTYAEVRDIVEVNYVP